MKKVYTTILSSFMVATAAASMPAAGSVPNGMESVKSEAEAALFKGARRVEAGQASEGPKATRNDLLGTYVWDHYRFMNPGGWQYMFCFPEIVAGENPDEVIIEGFWADYDDSVYPPVPITRAKATFDYEAQTLSIEPGQYLGQYDEYPHYIYLSDWNTDMMLDQPIVFNVLNSGRLIHYKCNFQENGYPADCILITSYPDKVGQVVDKGVDFIGEIVMNRYSEIMEVANTTTGDEGYCPVFVRRTMDGFIVHNFGGYGYEPGLEFSVDLGKRTCKASRMLFKKDVQVSDGSVTDIYFASVTGGDIEGTLTPTSEKDVYTVNIGEWSFYDGKKNEPNVLFSRSSFPVNLSLAGVDRLESDTDAPVEYFTLQGVRVANPEKGMLVIKRHGSKIEKIVVD